jgi:hypothetical protein
MNFAMTIESAYGRAVKIYQRESGTVQPYGDIMMEQRKLLRHVTTTLKSLATEECAQMHMLCDYDLINVVRSRIAGVDSQDELTWDIVEIYATI